ncbi:hypothetical protein DHEL01_v203615 [Diaporthe helianthi]|uniref:Uncharacterized protein n=1 Tax=Diaporthe helianthi TaxID=158607 RepID=A0A2P5I664_DIAHE|nr:hypothetical protein DHEL01_v203615 [Diaporthe helianthi]
MARDRERGDSISPSAGQSKRSANQQDSDSLDSDQTHQSQQQQQQQQRTHHKAQRHHVGGGGARLHPRVPSSKGLSKHNTSASSTKLNRRVTSPSPERNTGLAAGHRRHHSSEVKLSRDHSTTSLKKNHSQTSLKRNRSQVEVAKRTKPQNQLTRSSSEKAVSKFKSSKSAVHFDLGNDGQEDEWIDASSSASPYLSRRGSVNTSGQSSGNAQGSVVGSPAGGVNGDEEPTPLAEPQKLLFAGDKEHSRTLTSKLLQRTPSHSATTGMSNTMAMARAASPDSRHSASTLSVTPAQPQGVVGSNGQEEVTSRFVSQTAASSFTSSGPRRPRSVGDFPSSANNGLSGNSEVRDDDDLTNEEDKGVTSSAIATTARSREVGAVAAAPSEKSRTQQKINLQRASSSMEPVRHRHSGIGGFAAEVAEVAGPLLGGAGYDSQDPRVNKLLERTGVEYNIVRRYQNPVARSLVRLAQLPGNDSARRIPRPGTAGGAGSRSSANLAGGGQFGLSQSFRDARDGANGARRPPTPRRAHTSVRNSGTGSSLDTDDGGASRLHEGQGLSGASLVNGDDDDGIQVILRSMWDKSTLDLAASQ